MSACAVLSHGATKDDLCNKLASKLWASVNNAEARNHEEDPWLGTAAARGSLVETARPWQRHPGGADMPWGTDASE
jgi:hypothetical protein